MLKIIQEGQARVKVATGKISKQLQVFYNPLMKLNRDLSILLLNSIPLNHLQACDPLAGSGIRSIRFLLEIKPKKIKSLLINDNDKKSFQTIKNNLQLNQIKTSQDKKFMVTITNQDANLLLLNSKGFDYIDIDPFGSPNPFLDAAVKRLSRNGILAVTATDTAPLCGTYPQTCLRKYWATPLHYSLMHEVGLRILIRKCQLVAFQSEKALLPLFCYYKDHYFRLFFQAIKGKQKCTPLLKQHQYLLFCPRCFSYQISNTNQGQCLCHSPFQAAGPIYTGPLFDQKLVQKMKKLNLLKENQKFLDTIYQESKLNFPFFYDLNQLCSLNKLTIPKKEKIIQAIKNKNFQASPTHFNYSAIKTNAPLQKIILIIKKI